MRVLIVSSPVAPLGDGRTGGITRQLETMCKALVLHDHQFQILAPDGSDLSPFNQNLHCIEGTLQPTLASNESEAVYPIPVGGVLGQMWQAAFERQNQFDVILNVAQDWLPYYVCAFFETPVCHMVNMGDVDRTTSHEIIQCANGTRNPVAFLSQTQAAQFDGLRNPMIVPLGLDLDTYHFVEAPSSGLIWGGRISPEKGLEDALEITKRCGGTLAIAGCVDDQVYWRDLEERYRPQIDFRGFMNQTDFQNFLGSGRALLQTQKWQEAFGLVTIEAQACGTPVIAYDRGANAELIDHGETGYITSPDDIDEIIRVLPNISDIDRRACRKAAEERYDLPAFAKRLEGWLETVLTDTASP